MATNYSWVCPYCNHAATITEENSSGDTYRFNMNNKDGLLTLLTSVIVCPNRECREYVIHCMLRRTQTDIRTGSSSYVGDPLFSVRLRPQSAAKPFPSYIPQQIIQDYNESCHVVALSPKASATLSRRCLQGMIRNFWGITEKRLIDEISALHDKVDNTTWQAIDAVRSIGNIGAHMEKDINLIIDVEPGEAELLIGLIETLLEEWYVRQHERDERMQKIIGAAAAKAAAKTSG